MAIGNTVISFGAFPGSSQATVDVTGQTSILSTSHTQAELMIVATADHSVDEHHILSGRIKVTAGAPREGDGFTIYATYESSGTSAGSCCIHGDFSIKWVWV